MREWERRKMSDKQTCGNCRFLRMHGSESRCHRRSPKPHSFLRYYEAELLRDLAWSVRELAYPNGGDADDPDDDLRVEATEASIETSWPEVMLDEWCGEWDLGAAGRSRGFELVDYEDDQLC